MRWMQAKTQLPRGVLPQERLGAGPEKEETVLFGKKKLRQAEQRIGELEEILCPRGQHDWELSGTEFDDDNGHGGGSFTFHYSCKRCKRKTSSVVPLHERRKFQ